MMNKMQSISVAFIDVNSVKFAYIEQKFKIYIILRRHIYVAKYKWNCFKSDSYPISKSTRSDQV